MENFIKISNYYYNLDHLIKISDLEGTCFSMNFSDGDNISICRRTYEAAKSIHTEILKKLGVE